MSGASRLPKNAIGSCTIDKNSKKLFCASENGTLTVSDRSTSHVPKSSRGFLELTIWNGEKILEKSCPVVDTTALSCLIIKTLCEVVRDTEKLLSVDFQR